MIWSIERVSAGASFRKVVYQYIANISIFSNKNMRLIHLQLCFLFVFIAFRPVMVVSELILLQHFPINPVLIMEVENRLNRLLRYLRIKENRYNNMELYQRVKVCEMYLGDLTKQSAIDYANVMDGKGNAVKGKGNIVLGSHVKLEGNKNWVFSKNYDGVSDGTLIVDKWKINLDKIEMIKTDPSAVIVKWTKQETK